MIATAVIFLSSLFCTGQDIAPAPADKAVVYFARVSSLGFAINFSYFDSATLVWKSNGSNYFRYECAPGSHLFWARSENRDFVEAEVEAGKIYFLEAVPKMGAIKAGVRLEVIDPQNPADQKRVSKILKLIGKKSPESFTAEDQEKEAKNLEDAVKRGLEKYKEDKEKGEKIARLEKTMNYTPEPAK